MAKESKKESNMQAFLVDFLLGGVSGAVAKTLTAPIERVKLVVQTQDANPKIRSGEVPRYTGMVDCAQRILKEQGLYRFWDGNLTNCLRYFPTQAFNLAFKDTFKKMFPKYNPKTEAWLLRLLCFARSEFWQFFGANLVSGGLAAAASMTIVYPLDYARTRLASDVGSGKATFSGLGDCLIKTAKGPGGFFALYTGFGVSVCGIIGYRGLQLGTFDTITGLNPWKKDPGLMGAVSTFGAAQTAITIGAGATYPFDTVRRRLQMQSEKPVEETLASSGEHIYKGTMDCFKKIAAEEGLVSGLYKGFLANVVRSVGGALVLVLYDRAKIRFSFALRPSSLIFAMAKEGKKESNMQAFLVDFLLGGVSGAVAKTLTAPIERVKLVVQTQDANPKIRSGEVPRYTGCLANEIGSVEFWQFFGANLVSGGLAAAASMTIVYPLDYARTRLASDVGSGKATFSGLGDCLIKTAKGPGLVGSGGFFALYTGFGVSVCGIIGYRGLQLGTFDTITGARGSCSDRWWLGWWWWQLIVGW
eukprot:Skav223259  [mRNA]  locus=scaffold1037:143604:157559:- [translate_table: standard]